jgi:intracellular multiplication protein IcmE
MIASGTFSGGKLLGSFTAREEYLVIKFTTLVTKKGTSVPINAFAVDPQTSLTGVATDVDHRYFQRIVLPAAAKFVEGLGDAYAQTTTSTSQSSTSTVTTTEDLDTKQQFGKGVSEAAKQVGDVLSEDGKSVKPLVIVAAGTPIGVLFMAPVTDQDLLKARVGVSSTNQQQVNDTNTQQQNPYLQNQNNLTAYQQLQLGLQNQQFLQQGTYYGGQTTNTTGTTTGQ